MKKYREEIDKLIEEEKKLLETIEKLFASITPEIKRENSYVDDAWNRINGLKVSTMTAIEELQRISETLEKGEDPDLVRLKTLERW